MTRRRVAACYGYNVRLGALVQLALLTGTRSLDQRALKPLLTEALAYPDDRAPAYGQRIRYSVINLSFVGIEQRQRSLYRARLRSATVGDFTQPAWESVNSTLYLYAVIFGNILAVRCVPI